MKRIIASFKKTFHKKINYVFLKHYAKYDILGNTRYNPRSPLIIGNAFEFFLLPQYKADDYILAPANKKRNMLNLSYERWLEYCISNDVFLSQTLDFSKKRNPLTIKHSELIQTLYKNW